MKPPNPQGPDAPSTTAGRSQQSGPGLSIIAVAGIVVALAGAYAVFGPKQDDKVNMQPTPVSASSQPPQERPRPRRVKTAAPAQTSRPRRAQTASTPAPRRAAPMKLWEGDSE